MDKTTQHSPFFIIGAQRSGTTLLRLILNAHSKIAIPEEARFLLPFLKNKYLDTPLSGKTLENAVRYLASNAQFKQWNYDREPVLSTLEKRSEISLRELLDQIYTSYAANENKEIWADKSLFFRRIDILSEVFPDSKFIHLVRDGRDVFDSWRKMDKTKDNVAATAIDWNYKLYRINRSFARLADDRKLSVKYENLLENPVDTVQDICTFVGVEYEPQMLEYHKTSDKYIGKHHSELIFKSIDSSNINKWKKNLSNSELRAFELISGFNLKRYGYVLTGERNILLDPIYVAYKLVVGIPYRIYQVVLNTAVNELAFRKGTESTIDAAKLPNSKQK